jgi:glycosyltransferase involved in cell wall biosynthesis
VSIDVSIVVPLRYGASGGLLHGLLPLVSHFKTSRRVGSVAVHVPAHVLYEIENLPVPVRRYPKRVLGLGRRFQPAIERTGAEVVLSITARPIDVPRSPVVTVVRNVEPIQTPSYRIPFLWKLRLAALRRETRTACRQATRVLAVSCYAADCLALLGVPSQKVDVTYHGAWLVGPTTGPPPCLRALDGPFLFTAGSLVPYRGLEDLIRAITVLKRTGAGVPPVVIAGSGGGLARPYEEWIRRLSMVSGSDDTIIWTGQLSSAEVSWCLRNAAAVITTSRAEACSIFQIEALQAGAWIIANGRPPMPEILEAAASYYEEGDAAQLGLLISRALTATPDEKRRRHAAALERGSYFTWQREAEGVLDSLEAARRQFEGITTGSQRSRSASSCS